MPGLLFSGKCLMYRIVMVECWKKFTSELCYLKKYLMFVIVQAKYVPLTLLIAYRAAELSANML